MQEEIGDVAKVEECRVRVKEGETNGFGKEGSECGRRKLCESESDCISNF